ncbi:MAG: energy-coupling factor transporter transmembrane component T [Roseiflexaceae bacterium]|nr:energy-coupling factor transporter transmembrane component T [Roseiflexaceae bacterium]
MLSIYTIGTSSLHRLHPLTKLTGALLLILATYLTNWPLVPVLVFAILLIIARIAGVAQRLTGTVLRLILPVTFSLFLIQGILFPPIGATPLPLGPITLTYEGLLFAYLIAARLLVLSTTILLVLFTTHPSDLVFALTERGLPRSVGYILLVSLQIVPDMTARATAILDVQRSRGLATDGALGRVRAIIPLIGPLVVGALVDVEERAMAIESRAYTASGPKTSLRVLADSIAQHRARTVMLLGIAALIIWRIATAIEIRIV